MHLTAQQQPEKHLLWRALAAKIAFKQRQAKPLPKYECRSLNAVGCQTYNLLTHFKIYTRARGREQFIVNRDFIHFTLEVLQTKYLLFFNLLEIFKGWNKFTTD